MYLAKMMNMESGKSDEQGLVLIYEKDIRELSLRLNSLLFFNVKSISQLVSNHHKGKHH